MWYIRIIIFCCENATCNVTVYHCCSFSFAYPQYHARILTSGSPIPPTVPPHRHSTASTLKAEREHAKQKKKKKRYLVISLVFSISQAFVSIYLFSCNVHWMLNLMLINPHISDVRPLIILFLISFSFFFL